MRSSLYLFLCWVAGSSAIPRCLWFTDGYGLPSCVETLPRALCCDVDGYFGGCVNGKWELGNCTNPQGGLGQCDQAWWGVACRVTKIVWAPPRALAPWRFPSSITCTKVIERMLRSEWQHTVCWKFENGYKISNIIKCRFRWNIPNHWNEIGRYGGCRIIDYVGVFINWHNHYLRSSDEK